MTTFVVKQSEASFEARFASPMFVLLGPTVIDLHQNMFLSLTKHGLTLGDIRVESGAPNLSGANATYWLNAFNAFVRVWMDRVEVFFADLKRVSGDQMLEITGHSLWMSYNVLCKILRWHYIQRHGQCTGYRKM